MECTEHIYVFPTVLLDRPINSRGQQQHLRITGACMPDCMPPMHGGREHAMRVSVTRHLPSLPVTYVRVLTILTCSDVMAYVAHGGGVRACMSAPPRPRRAAGADAHDGASCHLRTSRCICARKSSKYAWIDLTLV